MMFELYPIIKKILEFIFNAGVVVSVIILVICFLGMVLAPDDPNDKWFM
jgi:hypothetical protein